MSPICANLVIFFIRNIFPCQGCIVNENVGGYVCIGVEDRHDFTEVQKYIIDFDMYPRIQLGNSLCNNEYLKDDVKITTKTFKYHKPGNEMSTQISSACANITSIENDTIHKTAINLNQESNKLPPMIIKEIIIYSGHVNHCYLHTINIIPENLSTHTHYTLTSMSPQFDKRLYVVYMILFLLFVLLASISALQLLGQVFLNDNRTKAAAAEHSFESIHKSKDYLLAIVDTMSVGVVSTDNTMRITFMNSAAGQMCGCCPKAVTGRHIDDIVRLTNGSDTLHIEVLLRDSYRKHAILEDCQLIVESGGCVDVQQSVSPLAVGGELRGSVMLLHDVSAARALIKKLSYSASHDALTGLPNRANFEQYLRNTVTTSIRQKAQHALVYLDLDGFKAVNDKCGHAAGDALLKQVSQLMRLQLRKTDFLARLGGDEFALILFNCEIEQAKILVEHLLVQISEHCFCWEGNISRIGASAGITRIDASNTSVTELIAQADSECYNAKKRGKRQACLFQGCCT